MYNFGLYSNFNMLGKLYLTCRFNTDRSKMIQGPQSNLLVPPISGDFVFKMTDFVLKNSRLTAKMEKARPLYGRKVGAKFIAAVQDLVRHRAKTFGWSHERLGFWKKGPEYSGLF